MKIVLLYDQIILPKTELALKGSKARSMDGKNLEIDDKVIFLIRKKRIFNDFNKQSFHTGPLRSGLCRSCFQCLFLYIFSI